MSNRTRALILASMVAALNLAAMSAVARATDEPTGNQAARRSPTQGQVGESWHQPQVTAEQPNIASDARRPPTQSQVGESWRHQSSVPGRPAEPGGQPDWLVLGLGVLAAILALVAGVAVLAARRAGRKVRPSQAT